MTAAVVVALDHPTGGKYLAAYYTPGTDTGPGTPDTLRAHLTDRLPDYMVPTTYTELDTFPTTPNGKLDRTALPTPTPDTRTTGRPPHTPTEHTLTDIYRDILHLDPTTTLTTDDDFFALGGDSISSIQVVSRARRAGITLTAADVFAARTIAALAAIADSTDNIGPSLPVTTTSALLPIAAERVDRPGFEHFAQFFVFTAPVSATHDAVHDILAALAQLHPVLQGRLVRADDRTPHFVVPEEVSKEHVRLDVESVEQSWTSPEWAHRARSIAEERADALDPESGELWRAVLCQNDSSDSSRLVVVIHHLVVDGVSWRILEEDLAHGWTRYTGASADPFLISGTSMTSWTTALLDRGRSAAVADQRPFWTAVTESTTPLFGQRGIDPTLDTTATSADIDVTVPADVAEAILGGLRTTLSAEIDDILLGAVTIAVSAWRTRRNLEPKPVVIALEGHGRQESLVPGADLSRSLGWFTTWYPVRTSSADDIDIDIDIDHAAIPADPEAAANAVLRVKDRLASVPDRGIGYGLLRHPNAEVRLAGCLPDVGFNYLGRFGGISDSALWTAAPELPRLGAVLPPDLPAAAVVDINIAAVTGPDGLTSLVGTFTYATEILSVDDAQEFADLWVHTLTTLAEYDRTTDRRRRSPSDLTASNTSVVDIAEWENRYGDIDDVLPLTPLQAGMIFESSIGGAVHDAYVTQLSLRLEGRLDTARLDDAAAVLLKRYPNLRSGFSATASGDHVAVIPRETTLRSNHVDLSAATDTRAAADDFRARERSAPFDLERPPLMRLAAVTTEPDVHEVILTMHHTLADGWSNPAIAETLLTAYRSPDARIDVDSTFTRFTRWLTDADRSVSMQIWEHELAAVGEPTLLAGGTKAATSAVPERITVAADATATTTLARASGATVNTVVQAAWALTLGAVTGQDTVVFGATVSGRSIDISHTETAVGMFVNTIPTVVTLSAHASGLDTIARLQRRNDTVFAHHHVPLPDLHRTTGHPTLFDTLFVFQNYPVDDATYSTDYAGLRLTGMKVQDSTHYPLTIAVVPESTALRIEFSYYPELLDAASTTRIVEIFMRTLTALTENPSALTGSMNVLSNADRVLLEQWSAGPDATLPSDATLVSLVRDRVAETPEATAVTDPAGNTLTYSRFDAQVEALAGQLALAGIMRGDRVAVLLPRSVHLVVALHAVIRTGAAYIPMDPEYPSGRIEAIVEDGTPRAIVSDTATLARHGTFGAGLAVVAVDAPVSPTPLMPRTPPTSPSAEDTAYIIFTSGTTGRPKGVSISHAAIVNRLSWMRDDYGIGPSDRILQKTPAVFDVSVWEFFLPFVAGASLVIAADQGHKDPQYLVEVIDAQQVTVAHFVPAMLGAFLAAEPDPTRLTSLRHVFFSGEALPTDSALAADTLFRAAELHNLYGPTEASVDVTAHPVRTENTAASAVVPIGTPVAGTHVRVLDPWLRPVPPGVTGELYLGGVQLADGYIGRRELTAGRFVADPSHRSGSRLYRTGDLVRWNDGVLEYLGRSDDQVKIRGFRIELDEIRVVLDTHPAVDTAVVVATQQPGGATHLVAFYTGTETDTDELGTFAARTLPDYMVPSAFVHLPAFPTTANGKLDRRALPAPELHHSGDTGRPPRTRSEKVVAQVIREVLGLSDTDPLSVTDDFFRLGGDSILSIQVVSKSRRRGLTLTASDVFRGRTIEALATIADAEIDSAAVTLEHRNRSRLLPLAAHRAAHPGFEHFSQSFVFSVPAEATLDALSVVVRDAIGQHSALNARLIQDTSGKSILVLPENGGETRVSSRLTARRVDVAWDSAEWSVSARQTVQELSNELDPSAGDLWRAAWVTNGLDSASRLIFVIHHLVVDGVSWRVLEDDLAHAWRRTTGADSVPSPKERTSITTWSDAAWSRADDDVVTAQRDYWRGVVDDITPLFGEGTIDPALDTVATMSTVPVQVDADTTTTLLTATPVKLTARVEEILLAALTVAVSSWRARRGLTAAPVVIGLEGHGREETYVPGADLSRTIGWFTTWYPVPAANRTAVTHYSNVFTDPAQAARAVLHVKESLATVPDRGIGYGFLDIGGARPDVGFNYLGQFSRPHSAAWAGAPELPGIGGHAPDRLPAAAVLDLDITALAGHDGRTRFVGTFRFASRILSEPDALELSALFTEALASVAAYSESTDRQRKSPADLTARTVSFADLERFEERWGDIMDVQPLTPLQQGMVFETLRGETSTDAYLTQLTLHLSGELERSSIARAVTSLIAVYPNLRAVITVTEGGDHVAVVPTAVTDLSATFFDLSGGTPSAIQDRANAIRSTDRTCAFTLDEGPLIRATVITTGDRVHQVVLTMHHSLADGWSNPSIIQTFLDHYRAPDKPTVPDRTHQRFLEWLAGQDETESRHVWADTLAPVTEPTLLASTPGFAPDPLDEPVSGELVLTIDPIDTARLNSAARDRGATLSSLVQAVWATTLNAVTGNRTVVFGSTVSGRPPLLGGIDTAVGMFINTIATPVTVSGASTLGTLLDAVQNQNTALLDHHHTSLSEMHEIAGLTPLFDTLMVYENYPLDEDALTVARDGLTLSRVEAMDATHYPLTVAVIPTSTVLEFRFSYRGDRIDPEAVGRVVAIFQRVLDASTKSLDTAVAALDLVRSEDAADVLGWSAGTHTLVSQHSDDTLDSLLRRQIEATPDATAIVDDGGTSVTYREFDERVNRSAHHLRSSVARGDRVVILMPRSIELVVAMAAVMRCGAAYVPVDIEYPSERIRAVLDDAEPTVVITDARSADAHSEVLRDSGAVITTIDARTADAPLVARHLAPTDLAYVIFTSGTTGRPKGVMVSHAAIVNLIRWRRAEFPLVTGDRVLQKTSVGFDVSVAEIFWPLTVGGVVRLARPDGEKDLSYLASVLLSEPIVYADFVPTVLTAMLDDGFAPEQTSLRYLAVGGEALPANLARTLTRSDIRVTNMYGPTETTVDITAAHVAEDRLRNSSTVSIGSPIAGSYVRVLDGWLRPVGPGTVGELYLGGTGLARGYVGRPELTADRFVADPYAHSGERLYRTGDLVRWNATGTLDFLGRIDHQVKIRGVRIELDDIRVALEAAPSVSSAVVVDLDHPAGGKYLAAYYTGTDSALDVRRHVASRLPAHMVPAAFVRLDSLPTTPNGKLDRRALPAPSLVEADGASRAPEGDVEVALAALFATVLGLVGADELSAQDDFFRLGGHSLLATKLVARANALLGSGLTLGDIFESPTVEALARRVGTDSAGTRPRLADFEAPDRTPASYGQQALWLIDQMDGPGSRYVVPTVLRLTGSLDVQALFDAAKDVVARHESLRTLLVPEHGDVLQSVVAVDAASARLVLSHRDLRGSGATDVDLEIVRSIRQEFVLDRDLPFRLTILEVDEQQWTLVLAVHHHAVDEWSMPVLLSDLSTAYAARRGGSTPKWPSTPLSYGRYAAWQREVLGSASDTGSELSDHLDYWRTELVDSPEESVVSLDRARPSNPSHHAAFVTFSVDDELVGGLERVAAATGFSMFVISQTAVAISASMLGAGYDVVLGSPVGGRTEDGLEDMVGYFVNTLPLRHRLDPRDTFADVLGRAKDVVMHGFAHQAAPFEEIVRTVDAARGAGDGRVFQMMLTHSTLPDNPMSMDGLLVEDAGDIAAKALAAAKVDLDIDVEHSIGSMTVHITYASELFFENTIVRFAEVYRRVLAALANEPETRLASFDPMPVHLQRSVEQWSTGVERIESPATLDSLVRQQIRNTPQAVALIDADKTSFTYEQVDSRVNSMARLLVASGVGRGDRVAVVLPRSAALVVAVHAVVRVGAAYVPIDPSYPVDRIGNILVDAAPTLVVTDGAFQPVVTQPPVLRLDESDTERRLAECSAAPFEPVPTPADAAYVIFTSGTTGRPKGVVVSHSAIVNLIEWRQSVFPLGPGDRVLQKTSIGFDVSVPELFWPLMVGGTVRLVPPDTEKDPVALGRILGEEPIGFVELVPTVLQAMLDDGFDLSRAQLKHLSVGGEAFPGSLGRALTDTHVQVWNTYGPTEAAVEVTAFELTTDTHSAVVPIGRPVTGTSVHVRDPWLRPVPPGVIGELYIGGVQLADGYIGRPSLTATRFVADTTEVGERLYRTGDLARWTEDGLLEFLGRADDQVKIRGQRIELDEIRVVLESHPGVTSAVVLVSGADDATARLVAYHTGDGVGRDELRQFMSRSLPDVMIPAAIVHLKSFPRTVNGKLDPAALPAPSFGDGVVGRAPRSENEKIVAGVFRDVLEIDSETILCAEQDFFALGGHSLAATRVAAQVNAATGSTLTLREVFDARTIENLAAVVGPTRSTSTSAVADVVLPTEVPASFGQQSLWLIDRLGGPGSRYVVPTILQFEGDLDTDAFADAVRDVAARHEPLRTLLLEIGDTVVQRSIPIDDLAALLPFSVADVRGDDARVSAEIAGAVGAGFDVAVELPIRVTILRTTDSTWTVALVVHHHAIDEWSMPALLDDLANAYSARLRGDLPQWKPLPVSYPQFAVWQRTSLGDPDDEQSELAAHLRYWREHLSDAPQESLLTPDRPRPTSRTYHGADYAFAIDADVVDEVRRTAATHQVSMFAVAQAAVAVTTATLGGGTDVVIGTPVGGRDHDGLDRLVGYFVNTIPVRHRLDPHHSVRDILSAAHRAVLDGLAHQNAPFENIARAVNAEHTANRTPLFQTMLTHHSAQAETRRSWPGLKPIDSPVGSSALSASSLHAAKTDLEIHIEDSNEGMTGLITWATELYDESTITKFAHVFRLVLSLIARDVEDPLSAWDLLPTEDSVRIAALSTGPIVNQPATTLDSLVRARVAESPDSPAVIADGNTLTYRQFDEAVDALVLAMGSRSLRGERVAVMLPRSLDLVVALHAVIRAGAAYVPIDPEFPTERIRAIVDDARPAVMITDIATQAEHSGALSAIGQCVRVDEPPTDEVSVDPAAGAPIPPGASDAAYVIFTSGTTGRPKGVQVSHAAVVNRLRWMSSDYAINAEDRILQKTPAVFDVSVWEFFLPAVIGATLVIARDQGHKDPEYLADVVEKQRVTVMHFVPAMLGAFLAADIDPERMSSLRRVFFSGEALPPDSAVSAHRLFSGAELHNLYGPTEAAVDITAHPVVPETLTAATTVPIGVPVANSYVRVLDGWLRPAPAGAIGELYLGGVQLADGYIGRSELTASRFVADPHGAGRLYRTGDLVRWNSNGVLDYLGRSDDQVKIRGYRIELDEIRSVLERHRGVESAVAVAADHPAGGHYIAAYYIGTDVADAELLASAATALPEYMVPAVVIRVDAFPTTPNGKLDRRALPEPELVQRAAGGRVPETDQERILERVFRDVLNLTEDTALTVDDDFFRLGGDSIRAARVVSRAATSDLTLTLRDVFEKRTIGDIAGGLEPHTVLTEPVPLPTSSVLERLRESGDEPNDWVYTETIAAPGITLEQLRSSLIDLVGRTDALRMKITPVNKRIWTSEVLPAGSVELSKQVIELDTDAAAHVSSLVDVVDGLPIAAAILAGAGQVRVLVAVHAASADRKSLHRITLHLAGIRALESVNLTPALEQIDEDGQNADTSRLRDWAALTDGQVYDHTSEIWEHGNHTVLRVSESNPVAVADALSDVVETSRQHVTVDLDVDLLDVDLLDVDPKPVGPFTATRPYRRGEGDFPAREFPLLRHHNKSGRRTLKKAARSRILVTETYSPQPPLRAGVETEYDVVVRYRDVADTIELEILGLSDIACQRLLDAMRTQSTMSRTD
ncbi:non-ribosomal peptide synthetase [Rhodococcoides fascians]|uniref:non-ribosomal peptide synthetase n=1 Tax=Rhodococcoides fascians TaxID=1828 RepID=UPI0022A846CE|nr:non-ribosomal peptide synthetase [Rhodococcus fascians]